MNASNPVTFTVTAQPLPTPWLDQDLGQVGIAGSASFTNGTFTVKGAGSQVWGTADSFHFAYQVLSGDGTIVARVVSISPTSATPGVMIRDSLNPNAMSAVTAYCNSDAYLNYPSSTGGSPSQASAPAGSLPYWLKLSRSGSTVSAYTSADGVNWTPIGSPQTINMGQSVYIGLVVCSNSTASLATATFDNVSVSSIVAPPPSFTLSASPSSLSIPQGSSGASTISVTPQNGFSGSGSLSASGQPSGVTASFGTNPATASSTLTLTASSTAATGTFSVVVTGTSGSLTNTTTVALTVTAGRTALPSPWADGDVGTVGLVGSAAFTNGTFTVNGAGSQVWGTADSFHFAYQVLSGDGSIVARVVSISPTSATPGVMIRDSLNPNAMSAFGAYFNSNAYLNYRSSTGGSTSQASAPAGSLPYWLKLSRSGSTVSAYTSADGVNWTPIGSSQTINMGQSVYVGLALCSNNTSTLATATFDNVSVNSTAAPAPLISSVSATTGSVGSQVVLAGSGFGATQGNSIVTLNGAPVTINAWSNTAVTITIPSGATSGPLVVSVAPSMNDSNPIPFTVTAPQPSFMLSASPRSLSIPQGASGASTISVTPQNGFTGSVSLSASGLPSGVTASFSTNPATASSTLTLTASSSATTGTFSVVVTGTSGSLTGSTTVSVTVTSGPNFTLSASPSSLSIPQGASGTSTISVTPQNGFTGSVSLSASGQPSGVTASFSTNPATTSSTVTLTASSTATTGTFSDRESVV